MSMEYLFHLFRFKSFISAMFYDFQYVSRTCSTFIIVSGIVFLVSFLHCSLLVHRNTMGFHMGPVSCHLAEFVYSNSFFFFSF
jgi:hypothetical protein